jgi:hypothetical protein
MPDPGGRALAAADSLVAIYPDSAQSWLLQVSVQGASRIPHWLRVFSARERRFAALEKSLGARATVSPAEMEAMASFASLIEDSAAAARWRTRLLETYPSDPRTLWIVSFDQRLNGPDSARKELPRFETAWRSRSDARVLIVESGLMMAIQSTDSSAIERWTSRYAELPAPPFFVPESERRFEDPVLRTAVQRQLTATVRTLLAEPRVSRDLYYTREQDSLRRRFVAADALVIQSDAMLSAAQPRLALDTMNVAVGLISGAALPVCGSGSVYRGRAKVQFVLGDSASGRRDLAFGARTDSLPGRTCVRWAAAP